MSTSSFAIILTAYYPSVLATSTSLLQQTKTMEFTMEELGETVDASVSEPDVIEKPEHNYALYAYQHILSPVEGTIVNGLSNDSLDLVCDDTDERETKNFILSILSTDLTASEEMELRTHLNKKVLKGGTDSNVSSVSLQVTEEETVVHPNFHGCYHRLFIDQDDENKGFIVCFLLKQERGFELFQPDLDKYSQGLEWKMDGKFTNLETSVKSYLASWYSEVILYISRCMQRLQGNLQYVIYAALMDMSLDLASASDRHQVDLQRFMTACSLKEMLTSLDEVNLVHVSASKEPRSLRIDFSHEPLTIPETTTTTVFCQDWAETLLQASTSSPFCQRQIIENHKLKVIQDMNQLRRLMKQSETDHYALFRTYAFLKSSRNVQVLLYQSRSQSQTPQTGHVIDVLDSYISSRPVAVMSN